MLNTTAATLALRNRMLTLSVATTGTTSLSATSTGYARAAGSFVTDGFAVGMEVLASGFATAANNGYGVITSVTATALGIQGGRTVEAAGANELIVAGLPEGRVYDNATFTPVSGRPYIEEDFVPATSTLVSFPASGGMVEETGLHVIKWYGLSGTGVTGIRRSVDALLDLFTPGTTVTADGTTVRVRGNPGPYAGQLLAIDGGWTVCTLTIPWLARTTNAIAA